MFSIPHMIIIFVVVLIVFGPQKLPELARGLGKLMAEFRKASGDFKSAFETEMRDLERQAMLAERKKQAEVAAGSAAAEPTPAEPASQGTPPGTETPATEYTADGVPIDTRQTEASVIAEPAVTGPVITPVPESVPRSTEEPAAETSPESEASSGLAHESHPDATLMTPSHDTNRPA
ncbi:MAG TPA: twin-arginine translocase TatA/TatE family subunit [Candidatus Dormibacteraeota bacterium]|nr:twin-arginine translocase TatA/TatE family subunit [Candidatus Dormibacteraeota bacterium]